MNIMGWIAMIDLFFRLWPAIKEILGAITDVSEKVAMEAKIWEIFNTAPNPVVLMTTLSEEIDSWDEAYQKTVA